jgi:predicted DNA binding protein
MNNVIELEKLDNLHIVCRDQAQIAPKEIRVLKTAYGEQGPFDLERYVNVRALSSELRVAVWKEIGNI